MAINKKLIHFNTFENFNSKKLSANSENTQYTLGVNGEIQTGSPEILYQSIVYIKDVKLQWTHGQLFDSDANILAIDSSEILDDVETNTYVKYVALALSETLKTLTRLNIDAVSSSDLLTNLNNKQDIITDLDEIRTKAINSVQQESLALVATSGSYKDLSDTPNEITEAMISNWGFTKNTGTYSKPSTGIPKSDLHTDVLNALNKANTALLTHQDISGKQDVISDLETIRLGAAKGDTAVLPGTLANVATSGSYNDLTNKPTIPNAITENTVSEWGFTKNTGTITGAIINSADNVLVNPSGKLLLESLVVDVKMNGTSKLLPDGIVDLGNVITSHQDISGKQDKLVSGTNIKTINGESILGEGNINIESGSEQVQSDWNETDTSSLAYIANKPTIPTKTSELENDSGFLARGFTGYAVDDMHISNNLRNGTGDIIAWSYANKYIRVYDASKDNEILDIHASGDGTKFLSDDGTYKEISSNSSSSNGNGAYSEVNHGTSDTTFTLTPNTFHVWDEVTALDLSFGEETEGMANEFLFQFTSGSTATTLTLPDTVKWANDEVPTIEANMIYQVSILKGLGSCLMFKFITQLFPLIITDENVNENYLDVYNYLTSTYELPVSNNPNNGIYIEETININVTKLNGNINGIVKKISLYSDRILLWTDASIEDITVCAIKINGILETHYWD